MRLSDFVCLGCLMVKEFGFGTGSLGFQMKILKFIEV